jgi:hypothetical protein
MVKGEAVVSVGGGGSGDVLFFLQAVKQNMQINDREHAFNNRCFSFIIYIDWIVIKTMGAQVL